jgi:hypothetical protein
MTMIVVKVELHSAKGGPTQLRGEMHISNTGNHPEHPKRGNYRVELFAIRKGRPDSVPYRTGQVNHWPRDREPIMKLVQAALNAVYGAPAAVEPPCAQCGGPLGAGSAVCWCCAEGS